MVRYIVQRLLMLIPILLAVSVVIFVMMRILPGDAAVAFAIESPADLERIRQDLGLDKPIHVQYGIWFWRLLHGDLGRSIQLEKPVLDILLPQFVNTLILAAASFMLAILVGWTVGILSATKQYSLADRLAFWTGKDRDRIDRLFRQYGLMRDKWDRQDYQDRTIQAACDFTAQVWIPATAPKQPSDLRDDDSPASTTNYDAGEPSDLPEIEGPEVAASRGSDAVPRYLKQQRRWDWLVYAVIALVVIAINVLNLW